MYKMKNAATVTAAVLTVCYSKCNICADALQASSSFLRTPRGHNMAQRYLDEEHPFNYDPTTFDMGTSVDLSGEVQMGRPDGMQRKVQTSIETNVSRDYRYRFHSTAASAPQQMEEINEVPERQQQQRRTTARRRNIGSSILRRKKQISSPRGDLLTFEEETEIAEDIRRFRSVTRARDNLSNWMSREISKVGDHHGELSDYQWASSCSLSVDQLHDVMARGQEARTKLIKGNVGLVTMVAKRYHFMLRGNPGNPSGGGAGGTDATLKLDDLIQEGYMGIMEAAERFDPTKGFRFSTYATHWIRQRILRSIAESSRTIRLPVHVQTMIRNMHKKNKELEEKIGRPPSMPELAHEMGVPLDKIQLYQHLTKNVLSLELPVDRHSNTEDKRTLGDRVACTEMANPEDNFMSESLRGEVHTMLDALGHDERLVLTHRFGLEDGRPKSIREVAEGMGVSSDIVRTVETKALNKLRQPRMNYRLKDYVGGSEGSFGSGGEPVDYYAEQIHHGGGGMCNNYNMMANNDHVGGEQQEQQQHQQHYQYPHHTNGPSFNTVRDEPTPESVWSF